MLETTLRASLKRDLTLLVETSDDLIQAVDQGCWNEAHKTRRFHSVDGRIFEVTVSVRQVRPAEAPPHG